MSSKPYMHAKVRCDRDGCGWSEELPFDEVPQWLHRSCPICLFSPIVSDDDMKLWAAVKDRLDRWEELSEGEQEILRNLHINTSNADNTNGSNSNAQKTPNP